MVVAATSAYQTDDLARAAERVGVDVALGTDRCHVLAEEWWAGGALALDFRQPARAAAQIAEEAAREPIDGLVATDERTAYIAALAAARLGLPGNPPDAVRAAWSKLRFRRAMTAAGQPQPGFRDLPVDADLTAAARELGYPVVIKPLHLAASRGVMRADDDAQLLARADRLRALLADPEVIAADEEAAGRVLVESFVPGPEIAFEGLLVGGELRTLALFDKPDPLDGPFFAETIYVTPSALPPEVAGAAVAAVAGAARAIGLVEGPVHAELRLGSGAPMVLELAARSIGGLCARTLRFGAGVSLEELVIAHAVGRPHDPVDRTGAASGVLMLPVPEAGVLRAVDGVDAARAIGGIGDVVITARAGDTVVPLPEGHSYLGFVFATGERPEQVTAALRAAADAITVRIAPRL